MITRTDLAVMGVFPILVRRTYDSQSQLDTAVGAGWQLNYDLRLFNLPDGTVLVRKLCGALTTFVQNGSTFVPENPNTTEKLTQMSSGIYRLRYLDGTKTDFDTRGRLVTIEDRIGNRLELSYVGDSRINLTAASKFSTDLETPALSTRTYQLRMVRERTADGQLTGRSVTFEYDDLSGRMVSVEANDGRLVRYEHDRFGPKRGNLERVIGLTGIEETYGYGDARDPHNITSAQFGQGMAAVINEYSDDDRVTRQSVGPSVMRFDYSTPLRTTVTRQVRSDTGALLGTATTRYEYTADGFVTKLTDTFSNEFRTARDENGRRMQFQVFSAAELAKPTPTPQRSESFDYYSDGQLREERVRVSATEEIVTRFEYDQGLLSAIERFSTAAPEKVFRSETHWARNAAGFITVPAEYRRRRDDGTFTSTLIEVNANGQATALTPPSLDGQPLLRIIKTYFPTNGPSPGLLHETYIEVDGARIPDGQRTMAYDPRGFPSSAMDAGTLPGAPRRTTSVTTDDLGRPVVVTNALGEETVFTYRGPTTSSMTGAIFTAPPGYLLVEVEQGRRSATERGRINRFVYDASARLKETLRSNPNGTFESVARGVYDSEGDMLRITDASGRPLISTYDLRGMLETVTDVENHRTRREYDAEGRLSRFVDAANRETLYFYDGLGRLQRLEEPSTTVPRNTTFEYDALGNPLSVTNTSGDATRYEYDSIGQLTAIVRPLGQRTEVRFDDRGQQVSLTNGRGNVFRFKYTPFGELATVEEYADANDTSIDRTLSYVTDFSGNLRSTSDSSLNGGNPLYSFDYDALDRQTETTAHYIPTPAGMSRDRILRSTFDRLGDPETFTLNDVGGTLTQTFMFDHAGRLQRSVLPTGTVTTLTYRSDDRLERLAYSNGTALEIDYQPSGAVKELRAEQGAAQEIFSLRYATNPDFSIQRLEERLGGASVPTSVSSFDYDDRGLFKQASYTGDTNVPASESIAYDEDGNRTDPSDPNGFAYDANQRILRSPGGFTYGSDEDGNVTSIRLPNGKFVRFGYDAFGNAHTFENEDQGVTASLEYDTFGRRIRRTANGVTTYFLWDGARLLAEYDASGVRVKRFDYLTGTVPVALAQQGSSGEESMLVISDHRAAPRILTGSQGQIVWRANYDAFGSAAVDEDPDGNTRAVRFDGRGFRAGSYRREDPQISISISPNRPPRRPQEGYDPGTGRPLEAQGPPDKVTGFDRIDDPTESFGELGPFPEGGSEFGMGPIENASSNPCPSAEPAGKPGPDLSPLDKARNLLTGLLAAVALGKIDPLEATKFLLDLAGFAPGAGAIPDVISAVISAAQGNFAEALASVAAAIPGVGDLFAAGKLAVKGGTRGAEIYQLASRLGNALSAGCFTAGTPVLTAHGFVDIEKLRPGDRVWTRTSGEPDGAATAVDASWRLITLEMPDPRYPDQTIDVELLRPPEWVLEVDAEAGVSIWVDLPEIGVHGDARVLSIRGPPEIATGPGRVVLATIERTSGGLLRVDLAGQEAPLEVTATHPLFSVDRETWVPAGDLQIGERLATAAGRATAVQRIRSVPGLHRVYNLEVETDHEYHASDSAVLAHNSGARSCAVGSGRDIVRRFDSRANAKAAKKRGIEFDPGEGEGIPTTTTSIEPADPDAIRELLGAKNADAFIDIDITGKKVLERRTKSGVPEIVVQESISPGDIIQTGRVRKSGR